MWDSDGGEDAMFTHIMVGSNDIARSKKFYDAIDGKPACHANGGTIGFAMSSQDQGAAWHKAGLANGGTTIEDPPGVRRGVVYLAYLRDPDGNKLVGVYRLPG
jgi:catechol 2,3-dioxygenase-like lactoylglutathione lyase family enzyme